MIGNNDYAHLPKLKTAVADAEAVADVLSEKYGFGVTLLRDANRYQILSALNELRARLTEDDNLLIYYAGHGTLDEVNQRGNWLPVDAEPESSANWISNVSLTDVLNAMSARHILVVADFVLFRGADPDGAARAGIRHVGRLAARVVESDCGQPVAHCAHLWRSRADARRRWRRAFGVRARLAGRACTPTAG